MSKILGKTIFPSGEIRLDGGAMTFEKAMDPHVFTSVEGGETPLPISIRSMPEVPSELAIVGKDIKYHHYQIVVTHAEIENGRDLNRLLETHKYSISRMGYRAVNIMSVTPDHMLNAWAIRIQCVREEGELYEVLEDAFEEDIMPQIFTHRDLIRGTHHSQEPKAAGKTLGEIVARRKLQAVI